jgi:hypothetical protein
MPRPSLRRPLRLLLAFAAAALNALAPVLAYAAGQPLHELAGGRPGGGARAVPAAHAHHHALGHAHAVSPHTLDHEKPAAPHCPYCLDFAAGAPLAPALLPPAIVQPGPEPRVIVAPARLVTRSSLRLASPRAPPSAA